MPLQETGGQRAWPAGDCTPRAGALPAAGWSLVLAGAPGDLRLHHPPRPPPDLAESLGPGAISGRSSGCHLDDAALQLRTALSSSS